MTELDLAEQLHRISSTPAPNAPDLQHFLQAGRKARSRRRQARWGAGLAGFVVLSAATGITLSAGTGRSHTPTTLAASPAPNADEPLTWSHWETSYNDEAYIMKNGVPVLKHFETAATYYGYETDTVLDDGTPAAPETSVFNPRPDTATKASSTTPAYWQDLWNAPRDVDALRTWVLQHRSGSQPGGNAAQEQTVQQMLTEPAPMSLRLALVSLLATFPDTTATTGTDAMDRPAVVTTETQGGGYQSFQTYTDPATGKILETAVLAEKPSSPSDLPAGHVDFAYIFTTDGPVDTAPSVTPKRSDAIAPNTTETPTCTPGTADDPTDATAVALAKLCVPDPAAGFPHRVSPDNFGDGIGRAFVVSSDTAGTSQIRLQIDADDQFFLSKASSPTPRNGKVGDDTYVGSRTVLGVSASEVRDTDGNPMLVLERDGFGIETVGTKGITFDQLAALTDQLQGLD